MDETATAAATARLPRPTPATAIFVGTRVGIWILAAFTLAWFPRRGGGFGTTLWVRSDSNWYLTIAHHGYAADPQHRPAFFPLYPALIAGLGRVLDNYDLAGLLISLAACAAAFELLRHLAERHVDRGAATRSVLYLALFPMAVFLGAVYSESLFLALALAAFVLAERGHWPAAAVAAGAATLTRSVGVAVVAGLVVMAWPDIRKLAWLAIAPVIFAAFPLTLQLQVHDPWAFVRAQDLWERHVSRWGPFGGLWYAIRALWRTNHNFTEHFYLAVNIESLVFLAFFIALIPIVWRHVGVPYAVFTAVVLAVPMSVPSDRGDFPLFSMPRFTIMAFPCFIALAVIGRRPSANTAIVASSSAMLGVAIVQWTLATLS